MSGIYDINGNLQNSAYNADGSLLHDAFDIDGNSLIVPSGQRFVVMSYNVQWFTGLNANTTMQQGIIDTYDPDIIGLQELGANPSISAGTGLFENYGYMYFGNQTNKTGIASKNLLSNVLSSVFQNQQGETRGYNKSYFTIDGKTICWINTHLATSNNESAKVAQAHEMYEMVQNETYFIITGDFNTVCKSVNDTEYTTIMKQFIDAGYNSANCSAQHGFIDTWTSGSTASGTWYPCDHVITSANIDIDEVIVDTRKIDVAAQTAQSIDHLPIIAYLTIY